MGQKKQPYKVELEDGETRWEFIIDGPPDPVTGKRKQIRRRRKTRKEAADLMAELMHTRNTGTLVMRNKLTVSEYLNTWSAGHCRDLEAATVRHLRDTLAPVHDRLGERELQSITKADVDALVDWMSTSGRKRGGKAGTGLGAGTVNATLSKFQTVMDMAQAEGLITRNPVRLVKRLKAPKAVHKLWTDAEEAAFFEVADGDRLAAAIGLFSRALRPEELCGIRWDDISFKGKTAAVGNHVRTMVEGKPVEKSAKTEAGIRTLPLDDDLADALKALHAAQAAEKLAAGPEYADGSDGGYVLCDELGQPFMVDGLRRYMRRLMRQAGVSEITPYEAMRHGAASRMARRGVPAQDIAAWIGHTDAAFTYRTYIHSRPEDLAEARDALDRKAA